MDKATDGDIPENNVQLEIKLQFVSFEALKISLQTRKAAADGSLSCLIILEFI